MGTVLTIEMATVVMVVMMTAVTKATKTSRTQVRRLQTLRDDEDQEGNAQRRITANSSTYTSRASGQLSSSTTELAAATEVQ